MEIEVKTKKWGNSIGIIVPWEAVRALKLKEGELLIAQLKRKDNGLKELFGSLKFSKPTKQILDEARAEYESKWMR